MIHDTNTAMAIHEAGHFIALRSPVCERFYCHLHTIDGITIVPGVAEDGTEYEAKAFGGALGPQDWRTGSPRIPECLIRPLALARSGVLQGGIEAQVLFGANRAEVRPGAADDFAQIKSTAKALGLIHRSIRFHGRRWVKSYLAANKQRVEAIAGALVRHKTLTEAQLDEAAGFDHASRIESRIALRKAALESERSRHDG